MSCLNFSTSAKRTCHVFGYLWDKEGRHTRFPFGGPHPLRFRSFFLKATYTLETTLYQHSEALDNPPECACRKVAALRSARLTHNRLMCVKLLSFPEQGVEHFRCESLSGPRKQGEGNDREQGFASSGTAHEGGLRT
jgi:hypothetical protein